MGPQSSGALAEKHGTHYTANCQSHGDELHANTTHSNMQVHCKLLYIVLSMYISIQTDPKDCLNSHSNYSEAAFWTESHFETILANRSLLAFLFQSVLSFFGLRFALNNKNKVFQKMLCSVNAKHPK